MFYNIKPFIFALCFHGIRFKVNKDWLSGIDSLFLYAYPPSFNSNSSLFFAFMAFYPFLSINLSTQSTKILYFASIINVKRETQIRKVMSIKVRLIIMNFLQFFVWGHG